MQACAPRGVERCCCLDARRGAARRTASDIGPGSAHRGTTRSSRAAGEPARGSPLNPGPR
eukprot:CAMPEP_0119265624 /NCGR_PEP_ID=MMETSP1329-20130426/4388_1 /TAXON_ID=114041 /ORGANISM="Genus nov. species nov., Strain RCC1024" /LENGTH=59 /DNA_ID=CAMNT_0007265463 /DNA_START=22 /DNA_END=198 /DNA_ORIENTATION=+